MIQRAVDNVFSANRPKCIVYCREINLTEKIIESTVTATKKNQKQPPERSIKNCIIISFAKFTGRYLCQGLFFKKVADAFGLLKPTLLTGHRFENLPMCLCSYKNNTLKIPHS